MDKWEIILKLHNYLPQINKYKCLVCNKHYKTEMGIYKHIENNHIKEINDYRDKEIIDSLED